jgi:hypothetical protein
MINLITLHKNKNKIFTDTPSLEELFGGESVYGLVHFRSSAIVGGHFLIVSIENNSNK